MEISELYELFRASKGVNTDTRTLQPGQIFVALKGETFDGNTYAAKALEAGASYAVVNDYVEGDDPRLIKFPDTLQALKELAACHRRQLSVPVIGLTGTNGKTTTKELIREVLSTHFKALEWECFPCWSPDGKYLYFVSAHFEVQDYSIREREIIDRYQEFKYNLYRKPFDPETKHFGPKELVYDASSVGKSITLPRVSPDGRYLLATIGDYGVFHIWHRSADLMLFDMESGTSRLLRETNSNDTESFHNWSTNGRWIIFSSRRDDGSFTRLYLTYFDKRGRARKPFVIPQKDPDFYLNFYRSYNIPEFMTGPVTITPHEIAKCLNGDVTGAVYHEAY